MTTTREIGALGLGAKTSMELSDTDLAKKGLKSTKRQLTSLRESCAEIQNETFRALGLAVRVDHRTLKEQRIEREPTHLGPAVSGMHRRGMQTEVGKRIAQEQRRVSEMRIQRIAEIRQVERERREVEASIRDLSGDLAAAQRDLVEHRPSVSLEKKWRALRAQRCLISVSPLTIKIVLFVDRL